MSTIVFTEQERVTLRTAAYGAVALVAAAGAADGSAHKGATAGSIALTSATGLVGHVLAEKSGGVGVYGKSVAGLADQVLPALTGAMSLLNQKDPAEAVNFRSTVMIAIETAAQSGRGVPSPAVAEMARKITGALDAA